MWIKNIQEIVESLNNQDLIIIGANAIDTRGRAALAFCRFGGRQQRICFA